MGESLLSAPRVSRLAKLRVPLVFLLALPFFLKLTFPFDAVSRRLEVEARKNGLELSIGSLDSTGVFGVRALDLKAHGATASIGSGPELVLDRVDVSPDVLGLVLRKIGFGFDVDAYGGNARGHLRLSRDPKAPGLSGLVLDASELDLKSLPLQQLANAEAIGKLGLKTDLTSLQAPEEANGTVALTLKSAAVLKGTLALGPGMSFPLPKVVLGDVDGSVSIAKGLAKIEKLSARNGDIEADVDGTIRLKPLLQVSEANLRVRLKFTDKWLDANPLVKGSLGFLGPKQPDGYWITLSGPLSRLVPRPGK